MTTLARSPVRAVLSHDGNTALEMPLILIRLIQEMPSNFPIFKNISAKRKACIFQ